MGAGQTGNRNLHMCAQDPHHGDSLPYAHTDTVNSAPNHPPGAVDPRYRPGPCRLDTVHHKNSATRDVESTAESSGDFSAKEHPHFLCPSEPVTILNNASDWICPACQPGCLNMPLLTAYDLQKQYLIAEEDVPLPQRGATCRMSRHQLRHGIQSPQRRARDRPRASLDRTSVPMNSHHDPCAAEVASLFPT